MSPTDLVEASDEQRDARLGIVIAGPVLVLFRVGVFLASGQRLMLADLKPGVHAPRGAHCRGQDRADSEAGRVAVVEIDRVDIRGINEKVRAIEMRGLVGDFVEVRLEFPLGGAPGEVGLALLKPHLAQGSHHLGTGEGLR